MSHRASCAERHLSGGLIWSQQFVDSRGAGPDVADQDTADEIARDTAVSAYHADEILDRPTGNGNDEGSREISPPDQGVDRPFSQFERRDLAFASRQSVLQSRKQQIDRVR